MIASPCVAASSLRAFKFREKIEGVAGARE
jgi:hypothetical protein